MTTVIRCLVLARIAAAVTVSTGNGAEDARHRSVMRAEKVSASSTAISSNGQASLAQLRPAEGDGEGDGGGTVVSTVVTADPNVPITPCDNAYPVGNDGTSTCKKAHHNLVVDPDMCDEAATMSNAHTEVHNFVLKELEWDNHPHGCFAETCKDSSHTCYRFNPIGQDAGYGTTTGISTSLTGTPICFMAHYVNGTTNANDGCAQGYGNIMNEDLCQAAASCLGYCIGGDNAAIYSDMRWGVDNATKHMEVPNGCFIHPADSCFYYNFPSQLGMPTHPKGIPVCNATSEDPGASWLQKEKAAQK